MKKYLFMAVMAVGAILLGSCDKSPSEYFYTGIAHPGSTVLELTADNQIDSICFVVSDDWKLSTDCAWLHLPADPNRTSGKVKAGYITRYCVIVSVDANETGTERLGCINLTSHGTTLPAYYLQKAAEKTEK